MAAKNDGKYLEENLRISFKDLKKRQSIKFHRFYDTHSVSNSGGILPAQPGDFFLMGKKACLLVECKTSLEEEGLTCAVIRKGKGQPGQHLDWNRAGQPSVYVFHCKAIDRYQVWEGKYAAGLTVQGLKRATLDKQFCFETNSYAQVLDKLLELVL